MHQPDAIRAVMHNGPAVGAARVDSAGDGASKGGVQASGGASVGASVGAAGSASSQDAAIPRSFTLPLPGPDRTLVDPRPGMALSGSRGDAGAPQAREAIDPTLADDLPRLWAKVLAAAQDNRRVRVVLADLTPVSLHEQVLSLRPAPSAMLAAKSQKGEIETMLLRLVGKRIAIDLIELAQEQSVATNTSTIETVSTHPLVAMAVELLGGKVIGVQPRRKS